MKKIIILAAFAATALLVGCNKEDVTSKVGMEVKLMIGEVQTKTSTNPADNTTTFSEGDKVGVFSSGLLETEMNNVLYSVGANAALSTTDQTEYLYNPEAATAKFHAYYPYSSEQVSGTTVSFTVSDQNTADLYNANDFLTTPNGGVAGTPEVPVALNFNHRLSLVKVVWNTPEVELTSVTLNNILPTVTWDYSTGAVSLHSEATAASIAMWEAKDNEYWALIPAQTFQSGATNALITVVTSESKTYQLIPTISVPFSEGKTKKITLTKEEEKLVATIANVGNIGNWDTSEEEEKLDVIISATDNITLGEVQTAISNVKNEGWYPVGSADYAVITVEDDNVIKIANTGNSVMGGNNGTTQQNLWYRRGIVYRSLDVPSAVNYTLKFKVKAERGEGQEVNPKLQIAVMLPEASTNTFFALNNTTNHNYIEPSTDYVEKTYSINLNSAGTNSSTPVTPDTSKGIVLLFTGTNLDNSTFFIKDISIIETPLDGTAVSVE